MSYGRGRDVPNLSAARGKRYADTWPLHRYRARKRRRGDGRTARQ